MPASLYDITIYCGDTQQTDASGQWLFSRAANFVCDFYHQMLFGYKPPKTTRINIVLTSTESGYEPRHHGTICSIAHLFDEKGFLPLSEKDQYNFLLDVVHGCCIELAERFGWDKVPFEKAYCEILKSNFSFVIDYPEKQSRDKKKSAHVQVLKTEDISALYLVFSLEEGVKKVKLFEKKNWFWSDIVYEMAQTSKWLNNSTFGVQAKRSDKVGYYSLEEDAIMGKLDFQITDL